MKYFFGVVLTLFNFLIFSVSYAAATYEKAQHRLPPVIYSLDIPKSVNANQNYNFEWSVMGYHDSYDIVISIYNANGTRIANETVSPHSEKKGEYSWGDITSKEFSYSVNLSLDFSGDQELMVRFFGRPLNDPIDNETFLSVIVPGGLGYEAGDSTGRKIKINGTGASSINPPILYTPNKSSTISRFGIPFSWSAVSSNSNNYRIVISRNSSFSGFTDAGGNSSCDSTCNTATTRGTNLNIDSLRLSNHTYYWKVRNAETNWSEVSYFTTDGYAAIEGEDLVFPSYGGSNTWKHDHGSNRHKTWYSNGVKINDIYALDLNQVSDQDNGLPVRPIHDGTIVHKNSNYGFIIVQHDTPLQLDDGTVLDSWYSGYMHMKNVSSASSVSTGSTLGNISNRVDGVYSGPNHLHFSIYSGSLTSGLTSIPLYKTNTKLKDFSKKISTWVTCSGNCY